MLAALAWRNLWRRPQRTVLSLVSIAIVSAPCWFVCCRSRSGVYATMTETTLRIFDGYAELQPAGYAEDPTLDRDHRPARRPRAGRRGDPGRRRRGAAGQRLRHPGQRAAQLRRGGDRGRPGERSAHLLHRLTRSEQGRYLSPADTDAAVLGDILARNLRLSVGGKVTLLGEARDGSVAADVLRVVGIYHSGVPDLDRTILEMPFARAQDTFGMDGAANTIALGGGSLGAVDAALPALRVAAAKSGVDLLDWQALEPALRDGIELKYATSATFYATLVLVVAFIILNTLLMSVLERTREFGMLMAVGMRASQIGAMVWMELVGLALLGCAIGIAVGGGITLWLQADRDRSSPASDRCWRNTACRQRLYPALTPLSAPWSVPARS